jgi:hypothetical protein
MLGKFVVAGGIAARVQPLARKHGRRLAFIEAAISPVISGRSVTSRAPSISSASLGITTALILGAVLLLSHPYTGIRHDGILYAGEALARMLPGEFHDDPYFLFGSQGRFTLLPTAYAWLITTFGLGGGSIVGMLTAFALYLGAAAWLVTWFAPSRLVAACLLSVVLGWSIYGGHRIFAYSEPFLTARSFAEPVNLFAIGLILRRRLILGAIVMLIAFAIHPLLSIGGALLIWCYLALDKPRWLIVPVIGLVVLAGCASVGFGPFDDVATRYDRQWLDYLHEVNPQAFVTTWTGRDYGVIAFTGGVMIFAIRLAREEAHRRFALAALAASVIALTTSVLLVDVGGNAFAGKLQVARAVWLMQWLAMAALPLIVVALWNKGAHGRVAALFLVIGWIAPFSIAPGILAIMALLIDTIGRQFVVTQTTTRLVAGAALLACLIITVQFEIRVVQGARAQQLTGLEMLSQAVSLGVVLMIGALLFLRVAPRLGPAAPLIAVLLFVGATAGWDQRSPWKQKLEAVTPGAYLWTDLIEPGARVYWFRDLMAPWVLLGHANYYTDQQASGAVFSRDMVMELQRRQKVTAILEFQEQICRMMNNLSEKQSSCEPDVEAVRAACVDGGIDYIVMQSSLAGPSAIASYDTGVTENGYEKKFFLYRCSALKPG